MSLLEQKCVPCAGGAAALTHEQVAALMPELTLAWNVINNTKLSCAFSFRDFRGSMLFVDAVAALAEAEGHHPDIHIHYNKVRLELFTHAVDGLSENDFILAKKIEAITPKKSHTKP